MTYPIIPWVVRRDTEHPSQSVEGWHFVIGKDVFGRDAVAIDYEGGYRDEDGWLWMPGPDDMSGQPEFTQVHPTRQRRCMDEGRCQVCGKQPIPGELLLWIVPTHELRTTIAGLTATTYTPPVCPECEPVARRLCPQLRRSNWKTYVARRVLRYGVLGDIHRYPDGLREREAIVTKYESVAPRVIARQRVVRAIDLKEWGTSEDAVELLIEDLGKK